MMLYFLMGSLGWLAVITLLVIMIVLYIRLHQQLAQLQQDMAQLKNELKHQTPKQRKENTSLLQHSLSTNSVADSALNNSTVEENTSAINATTVQGIFDAKAPIADTVSSTAKSMPPPLPVDSSTPNFISTPATQPLVPDSQPLADRNSIAPIEPDERSFPIVTSLFHSIQNWFLGGNLVVRVGVLVLLVGVVLLLRLLSEYIEIPIGIKLSAIGVSGLALAGLGFKLVPKRFAYGITLQGAGLATAYLTTFFAYSVYQVMSSLPSFITLGILSAVTVALAVRQNAFPLALVALSGGFFAPILTSQDTGSLTGLFSCYLLLNITIAVIAH